MPDGANIGSGNRLVPLGTKPLSEQMSTQIYVVKIMVSVWEEPFKNSACLL